MSRWILTFDGRDKLIKTATELLSREMASRVGYVLPVVPLGELSAADREQNNVAVICRAGGDAEKKCRASGATKTPAASESYSIFVGRSAFSGDRQMIAVTGRDGRGALYGCVDLINKYLSRADVSLDEELPEWKIAASPAIKTRAVWTWGHVVYDYRGFFENMARLRMNEIIIWNDVPPMNAADVVGCAHSYGIKVIWGFAWGWSTKCREELEKLDHASLSALKAQIASTYENVYAKMPGDGIYFQSFTELSLGTVGGKSVAEIVTPLVNDVSKTLLSRHPKLEIQFGLHATSVKERLDAIKTVDPRVRIVWEDCGAFPFDYDPEKTDGFDETLGFVEKTTVLRGKNEKYGAVVKGMLNLDWSTFEHFRESYILGERTRGFIEKRAAEKEEKWRDATRSWLKNAEFARKTVALIAEKNRGAVIEALIEDAMLEHSIKLPAALLSEIMWSPETSARELIEAASAYADGSEEK